MPIGKSAIKRVADNGYSKVTSTAPDMENSTVIAKLDPQVEEKMLPKTEASAVKKPAAKKAPAKATTKTTTAKKPAAKPVAAKAPAEKKKKEKDGFERFSLGADLPAHLL